MGGGTYSQDVAVGARSTNSDAFAYSAYQTTDDSGRARREVHPALSPFQTKREVNNETPIVVALDVTRSRGDDTKLMYEKLPMLMGQIELKGWVPNVGISFAAIGDAYSDQAPLQVGQFEGDNRLDEMISRLWIEEGGGGTGQESYELAAWYYSRADLVQLRKGSGRKGYFFFVGDEGFYPTVNKAHVRRVMGEDLPADLDSAEAFRRLDEKFDVFFIYPSKSFDQRKADIDAEIKQRVISAGGQYDNVDVRASLIWNNRNDLDLHVIPPSGEEVFFGHKKSSCGGWLDVDMNVSGETDKPVENVRWGKGQAPRGTYKVIVQNYAFHGDGAPSEFRMEIEVNGVVRQFDGVAGVKGKRGSDSNVLVYTFDFDPSVAGVAQTPPAPAPTEAERYSNYSDEVILGQWSTVVPKERILRIADPKAIIDVLLGALAISEGATDLSGFLADMRERNQTEERVAQVAAALVGVTNRKSLGGTSGDVPSGAPARAGRSKRI